MSSILGFAFSQISRDILFIPHERARVAIASVTVQPVALSDLNQISISRMRSLFVGGNFNCQCVLWTGSLSCTAIVYKTAVEGLMWSNGYHVIFFDANLLKMDLELKETGYKKRKYMIEINLEILVGTCKWLIRQFEKQPRTVTH